MDIQKVATYGTAATVLSTGAFVGGNNIIDQQTGGPQKRAEAEATELRLIIREEVKRAMWEAWPTTTGTTGTKPATNQDYREQVQGQRQ